MAADAELVQEAGAVLARHGYSTRPDDPWTWVCRSTRSSASPSPGCCSRTRAWSSSTKRRHTSRPQPRPRCRPRGLVGRPPSACRQSSPTVLQRREPPDQIAVIDGGRAVERETDDQFWSPGAGFSPAEAGPSSSSQPPSPPDPPYRAGSLAGADAVGSGDGPVREEHRVGLDYLDDVTALLQRIRSAHPTAGLYEPPICSGGGAAPRSTDDLPQLFWFDDLGRPEAAVIATDWGDRMRSTRSSCPTQLPTGLPTSSSAGSLTPVSRVRSRRPRGRPCR